MKLLRYGEPGHERPGLELADGRRVDASDLAADYDEAFFRRDGIAPLREWVEAGTPGAADLPADVRLGPPVARPSKIVCIGLNYRSHAAETGAPIPSEPVVFFKSTTALCGPADEIFVPHGSTQLDYEVELAAVVGRECRYLSEADAPGALAGFAIMNDVSERAFQKDRGGQWVKGKSSDRFAPLGPYLVTPDEVGDPGALRLELSVNGHLRQQGTSADLIFSVATVVAYLSQFMTLLPGDIISTGTPAGVGAGFDPPRFLAPGDGLELSISRLGRARQRIVADPRTPAAPQPTRP